MNYSNPVTSAHFPNWPYGRTKVCDCTFDLEQKGGKERMGRTTIQRSGKINKTKYTTYYERCLLVTGEDGKHYVLCKFESMIEIKKSDLKHTHETVWDTQDQFVELLELFDAVKISP